MREIDPARGGVKRPLRGRFDQCSGLDDELTLLGIPKKPGWYSSIRGADHSSWVVLFETVRGRTSFMVSVLSFEGASSPIVMWVLGFLAVQRDGRDLMRCAAC